eukprot:5706755-Amphidinium_carterae.1
MFNCEFGVPQPQIQGELQCWALNLALHQRSLACWGEEHGRPNTEPPPDSIRCKHQAGASMRENLKQLTSESTNPFIQNRS